MRQGQHHARAMARERGVTNEIALKAYDNQKAPRNPERVKG